MTLVLFAHDRIPSWTSPLTMVFDWTDEGQLTLFKGIIFYIWPTRWAKPSENLALFIRVSRRLFTDILSRSHGCLLTHCSAERGQVL
jgi:hypothetical protein